MRSKSWSNINTVVISQKSSNTCSLVSIASRTTFNSYLSANFVIECWACTLSTVFFYDAVGRFLSINWHVRTSIWHLMCNVDIMEEICLLRKRIGDVLRRYYLLALLNTPFTLLPLIRIRTRSLLKCCIVKTMTIYK